MNAVTLLARDILAMRGQDCVTCTVEQLASAYLKAEIITERLAAIAERVNERMDAA